MNRKQLRSSRTDHESLPSFEVEGSSGVQKRQYDGPCQDAVYSPVRGLDPGPLIGDSEPFDRVLNKIEIAVQNPLNLLLQGESGSGKSHVARTIHAQSERSDNWLVVVNCALIKADDVGALFLGPPGNRSNGLLEAAQGGTVVLDHIDALDSDAQVRLHHVLETHSFGPTGGEYSGRFDVRLIGLTTQRLSQTSFHKGFYYELSQFPIHLPPLRSRCGDALRLARHFLRQRTVGGEREEAFSLSPEVADLLRRYVWAGNVRELRNAILRAVSIATSSTIERSDFPDLCSESASCPESSTGSSSSQSETGGTRVEMESFFSGADGSIPKIEEMKQAAVKRAYELCDGNVDQAAVELGIGRSTMYRLLDRYEMK